MQNNLAFIKHLGKRKSWKNAVYWLARKLHISMVENKRKERADF